MAPSPSSSCSLGGTLGATMAPTSSSPLSSTSSFTSSEENTSNKDHSPLISISTSEEQSVPPTISSTSASLSSCGLQHVRVSTPHFLPSTLSSSLPPPPFSTASNVSLKNKPKGKNEPAKKKSKSTVVGKNDINAVKITSFSKMKNYVGMKIF